MSEQVGDNNQKMIAIALAVIAALLAVIVGFIVIQGNGAVPDPTAEATAPAATTAPNPNATSMGGGAAAGGATASGATTVQFDEKTATKVPAGMTPESMLKKYNEAVISGDFAAAYALLPLDKQKSYGDANAYAEQVKAYGITEYTIGEAKTEGDQMSIVTTQVTPQMPIAYTWTFKKVGEQWFVAARTMGGQ